MPAREHTASSAPRALWKGAISFGLVHVPVSLHPATREGGVDFDWIDRRTMEPVGYQRINKRTGKAVPKDAIAKGVATGDGEYVVLERDEIARAFPTSTKTIELEGFVAADAIPFVHLERPYVLAPTGRGAKVYALLREALLAAGRVGLARVVISSREHLAALVPDGPALMLALLRWQDEVRDWKGLDLPPAGARAAGLGARELTMARRLVDEMAIDWKPERYHDDFRTAVMALVEQKARAGQTESVAPQEPVPEWAPSGGDGKGGEVIDLTALLRRSLHGRSSASETERGRPSGRDGARPKTSRAPKAPSRGTSASKATPRRPASRRAARSR